VGRRPQPPNPHPPIPNPQSPIPRKKVLLKFYKMFNNNYKNLILNLNNEK